MKLVTIRHRRLFAAQIIIAAIMIALWVGIDIHTREAPLGNMFKYHHLPEMILMGLIGYDIGMREMKKERHDRLRLVCIALFALMFGSLMVVHDQLAEYPVVKVIGLVIFLAVLIAYIPLFVGYYGARKMDEKW